MRSKAHWGYDEAFLRACRPELTIDPAWCDGLRLEVAERDGELLGYSRISGAPPTGSLDGLFVDPAALGRGIGRTLLRRAAGRAARLGMTSLTIESDPYAEAFYLKLGAVRVGAVASPVTAGRSLPLLILSTGTSE